MLASQKSAAWGDPPSGQSRGGAGAAGLPQLRRHRRVIVGRVSEARHASGGGAAAATASKTTAVATAAAASAARAKAARRYFVERAAQRVQGPTEFPPPAGEESIDYNPLLNGSQTRPTPPQAFAPSRYATKVLEGTFSSTDFAADDAGASWPARLSALDVRRKRNARLMHLDAGIQAGMTLGAASTARHTRTGTAPAAAFSDIHDGLQRPQGRHAPVFHDHPAGATRLGATVYPETKERVEVIDCAAPMYCGPAERFQSKSRGLDVTWQKEAKVLAAAGYDRRLERRARNGSRITEVLEREVARAELQQDLRTAAIAKQYATYTTQVADMERFKARQK